MAGVSRQHIHKLVANKYFISACILGSQIAISEGEVEGWIQDRSLR